MRYETGEFTISWHRFKTIKKNGSVLSDDHTFKIWIQVVYIAFNIFNIKITAYWTTFF
jgi:hypothetical protein